MHSLFSKILDHFKYIPNQSCFVCLCKEGCSYLNIKSGISAQKNYLNKKCEKCQNNIGFYLDERGFCSSIKRNNYYRIFKTKEEADEEEKVNGYDYNYMTLEEFKKKYIIDKFKDEKGIPKNSKIFFLKDNKVVRSLSQITYRILNFVLYSHIIFSKLYNNNTNILDIYLPQDMSMIQVLIECWAMIKNELSKLGFNAIDLFMNYTFLDLFYSLNKHKAIKNYEELIIFETFLDKFVQSKILSFKEEYKSFNHSRNNSDKITFQDLIEERYEQLNEDEYPLYNYFYYSDYINDDFLLEKLKDPDKYPVLLKVLNSHSKKDKNPYSLENLPNFNEILNLFSEKYFNSIKRYKAERLQLKSIKNEDLFIDNRDAIKNFIKFYNGLSLKDKDGNPLILSDESKLADFFIDDNNEFGKSYKKIYAEFIKEQNKEISDLLDNKIKKGIFERDCENKICIQSANSNEIFILNLPDKFSFVEVVFNCSYRTFAITKDYNNYNNIKVNYALLEERMTELLLRNRKLFNDSISNFIYLNEKLEFENQNIITEFNTLYNIEKINIGDKKILYKFYEENKENNNLFKTIFDDFIQLIIFLNSNKKQNVIPLKDNSQISDAFMKFNKVSEDFKKIFQENNNLIISKTTYLFEYYRDLIFGKIKLGFKAFQENELQKEQEESIEKCFKELNLITKDEFKRAIRSFIVLFLNLEKNKETNIKENENNIVNYLDIPDIWNDSIYKNRNFQEELNNIRQINCKMNQVLPLYNSLGDDIDEKYFQDVKKVVEQEKEMKKAEENKEALNDEEQNPEENEEENKSFERDWNKENSDSEDDERGREYI